MPTIMPFSWGDDKPKVEVKPHGFRKWLRIPYIFSFPYFSGTLLQYDIVLKNESDNDTAIHYRADLFRLSGVTQQRADPINPVAGGNITINPRTKQRVVLKLAHLPQPGNYSLKLTLDTGNNPISSDIVYFDALPKDGTTFNVLMILASALIGFIAGLLTGWVIN